MGKSNNKFVFFMITLSVSSSMGEFYRNASVGELKKLKYVDGHILDLSVLNFNYRIKKIDTFSPACHIYGYDCYMKCEYISSVKLEEYLFNLRLQVCTFGENIWKKIAFRSIKISFAVPELPGFYFAVILCSFPA